MKQGRTEENRTKSRGKRLRYLGVLFAALLVIGLCQSAGISQAKNMRYAPDTSGTIQEDSEIYYLAKISAGKVNVRTGPGTSAEVLEVNGEKIQLKDGDSVTIIEEATNTDNELWYRVIFTRNGEKLEGYCIAKFVTKTGETITPTPTPSPSPTPEPTKEPTPTQAANPSPTKAPAKTDNEKSGGSLIKILLIVFLILFVLAAAYIAYYFLIFKKQKEEQRLRQKQQSGKPVARKRTGEEGAQGRTMRPESGGPGRTTGQVRPTQPGTKTGGTRPANGQVKRPAGTGASAGGVRVQTGTKPAEAAARPAGTKPVSGTQAGAGQAAKSVVPQEKGLNEQAQDARDIFTPKIQEAAPEDRSALREEINNLEAGDYVMHKYLGIGQVYDNSDVKLIEIRFGSDMRFLNKESCIMKKILRKCREDEI